MAGRVNAWLIVLIAGLLETGWALGLEAFEDKVTTRDSSQASLTPSGQRRVWGLSVGQGRLFYAVVWVCCV